MHLSSSTGALPLASPIGGSGAPGAAPPKGSARFVGPLPMMRLVQGFNMTPAGLPPRLYPVDRDVLADPALGAEPPLPLPPSAPGLPLAPAGHDEDGQGKLRWASEYVVGVGSPPVVPVPLYENESDYPPGSGERNSMYYIGFTLIVKHRLTSRPRPHAHGPTVKTD